MASASSIKFDLQDYALLKSYRHVGINETHFMHKKVQNLYYSRLELARTLEAHQGCVNSVDWDEQGRFLLSGSDDTRIAIWDYHGADMSRPKAEIGTGHVQNIFSARFFPGGRRIATASGDSDVRIFDTETLTCTHHFECFGTRAKRVDFETGNPNWVIACSEDGTVRQWDLRVDRPCRDAEAACPRIVIDSRPTPAEFMSLSVSPLLPNYFAVGGEEPVVRIYDRRHISGFNDFVNAWTPLESSRKLITGVSFAKDSMDLIASFSEGSIHLMNFMDPLEPANRATTKDPLFRESNLVKGTKFVHPLTEGLKGLEEELKQIEALSNIHYYTAEIRGLAAVALKLTPYVDTPNWRTVLCMLYYNLALAKARNARRMEELAGTEEEDYIDNIEANLGKALEMNDTLLREEIFLLDALTKIWHGDIEHAGHVLVKHLLAGTDGPCRNRTNLMHPINPTEPSEMTMLQRHGLTLYRDIVVPLLGRGLHSRIPWTALDTYLQALAPKSVLQSRSWKNIRNGKGSITTTTRFFSTHTNKQTVKDVSFVGPNSEFVASGSDGGLAFLWNRYTSELVWLAKADKFVCNMIQVHHCQH